LNKPEKNLSYKRSILWTTKLTLFTTHRRRS